MSQVTENPKGGCVLAGINSVLGAIDRVCPIYHSGPGCCMQTTAADQGQSGHKSSRFVSSVSLPSTNMLEKEVVSTYKPTGVAMGGKLYLYYTDRNNPEDTKQHVLYRYFINISDYLETHK
mgnify:CR=1 FL=1